MSATALAIAHGIAAIVLAALAVQTFLNWRRRPRLATVPSARARPRMAVLIPARNEAGSIGPCVEHWRRQRYPAYEVIVYDDESTDATASEAHEAGARVVRGRRLPAGWRGKTHACHRLRRHTDADILVFTDADVLAAPDTLERTAGAFETLEADVISAVPSHVSPSTIVRAVVALQNWAALALIPSWLPAARRSWRLAAANGQFFAIRAAVYDHCGGFAAVRDALGEDAALARRLARLGHGVRLVGGEKVLTCRPYAGFADLWTANVRNLYPALFGSPLLAALAIVALSALYAGPFVALALSAWSSSAAGLAAWLPALAIGLGLVSRVITDRDAGYPAWITLLHPAAVVVLVAMLVTSTVRALRGGTVVWRGRRYDLTTAA